MNSEQMRELAEWHDEEAASTRGMLPITEYKHRKTAALLRQCAEQRPVAWRKDLDPPNGNWTQMNIPRNPWPGSPHVQALYAAPLPQSTNAQREPLSDEQIADAQPVPAGWKLVPVEPTPEMLSAVGMMDGYDWHAPGCSPDADHANWYSAMIAAAPAASQAEPHRNQPLRDLLAVIHCDGGHHTEAVGIEQSIKDALSAVCVLKGNLAQAEPKREPLSDEQLDAAFRAEPEALLALVSGETTVGAFKTALRRLGRAVERAAYERAAQWVDKRAEDYDAEHGLTDPETGTREYPGNGDEYVFELHEIADGLRALKTNKEQAMNKLKQNTESAFPTAMGEGMTLRDYFAAQAMQAFIGKLVNGDETSSALIPELSYAMADVMLKAREGA